MRVGQEENCQAGLPAELFWPADAKEAVVPDHPVVGGEHVGAVGVVARSIDAVLESRACQETSVGVWLAFRGAPLHQLLTRIYDMQVEENCMRRACLSLDLHSMISYMAHGQTRNRHARRADHDRHSDDGIRHALAP